MFDIALPDKNEEELVKEYIRKGYKNIIFLYKVSSFEDIKIFRNIKNFPKINVYYGAIIDVSKMKEVLSLAAELFYNARFFNDFTFILARDFKFNRMVINKHFHNGLVNPGYLKVDDHPNVRYTPIPTKFLKKIVGFGRKLGTRNSPFIRFLVKYTSRANCGSYDFWSFVDIP